MNSSRGVRFTPREALVFFGVLVLLIVVLVVAVRHASPVRFADARGVVVQKYVSLPFKAGIVSYHVVVRTDSQQVVDVRVPWREYREVPVGSPVALDRRGRVISQR